MTLFEDNNDAIRPVARWIALGVCVAIVHAFALVICPSLILRGVSAGQVIAWAVCYALIVSAVAAAAAGAAFSSFPDRSIRQQDAVVAFALAGIWLAPLAVFFSRGSVWSIATAVIIACMLGHSFRLWRAPEQNNSGSTGSVLITTDPGNTQRLKCFGAALMIQSGVAAAVGGYNITGSYLTAFGAFLVVLWMSPAARHQSSSRTMAGAVLAIVLTAAGLLPLSHPRNASASTDRQGSSEDRKSGADDLYSGFILIPEVQPHTTIVPPLPALRRNLFRAGTTQPLSIPFSGEYWIYHWPLSRPPKNSVVARGTPTGFKFTATGDTPLVMQARQSFGRLIDIQCCSRIDLAISNTDPLPGTVTVELKLMNTTLEPKPAQSLGRVTIMSALPALVSGTAEPIKETLKFDIPAAPAMREFDEIVVRFHLHPSRKSRSANVAVERFYLVPQGG